MERIPPPPRLARLARVPSTPVAGGVSLTNCNPEPFPGALADAQRHQGSCALHRWCTHLATTRLLRRSDVRVAPMSASTLRTRRARLACCQRQRAWCQRVPFAPGTRLAHLAPAIGSGLQAGVAMNEESRRTRSVGAVRLRVGSVPASVPPVAPSLLRAPRVDSRWSTAEDSFADRKGPVPQHPGRRVDANKGPMRT